MRQFLKYVLATIVGIVILWVIGFVLLIAISAATSGKPSVAENSVLKLNLNSPVRERGVDNPFGGFGPINSSGDVIGLIDLRQALHDAKTDDNIKGVYLIAEYPQAGWSSLEEIRNALIDFKKSKKFVYAYGEVMTEKGYYLASVADKIWVNPAGSLEWNGLNAELMFFKGTLDKLGIKPEIFRVGEFKSAVEPFIRTDMSEPNRKQFTSFLNSIYSHFLVNVAQSRGLRVDSLRRYANNLSIQTAQDALSHKLITNAGYLDEVEAEIRQQLGTKETKKIEYITPDKYNDSEKETEDKGSNKNRIAVVIASGDISGGQGDDESIGSDRIAAELRKARLDDKVKAVVLRINSGGGSALASDVMWREVQLTRKVKPIVASFSDYAASGGYYMAMGCNKIVAEPNTITGSIGVFSILFNTETFFKDKLGITYDRVGTNKYADFPSVTHPLSDFEKQTLQRSTERVYAGFTKKVADGRKLSIDSVRAIAGGRVWTGTQGKAIGLVDQLGGLDEAVAVAAGEAKLSPKEYNLKYLPRQKNFMEQILGKLSGSDEEQLKVQLGELAPYVTYLKKLKNIEGVQARMPFEIKIN